MIEVLNPLTISDWMRLQVTRSRKVGNALKGATFISTISWNGFQTQNTRCVNALNGATFISTIRWQRNLYTTKYCVNALNGATFISTIQMKPFLYFIMKCVNALKGATSISTNDAINQSLKTEVLCQCPERGDLHFHFLKSYS